MMNRTAAAWDLIRSADPMASTALTGGSEARSAQDLLHRITADASVGSDVGTCEDTDVLTVLDVGPNRVRPRRRGLNAGLAAAIVILLVTVVVVAVRREKNTTSSTQQTTAAGYSKALLAELPLPTAARRVDRPPIPELTQPTRTGNGVLDAQVAWWTVPGSFSAAVARMGDARARPAHWSSSVSSSTGGAGSRSNGWLIEVRDPDARFVSSVTVTVAAHGTKVGLAAQVDTYARLIRTPDQVIPATADSASLALTGGAGGAYSSTLTLDLSGEQVTSVARAINATPTFVVLATVSCPAPQGSITVTFRRGSQRWLLNISAGSSLCNTPTLTGADGKSVTLTYSTALLTDVLAAVGLPSNYFNR